MLRKIIAYSIAAMLTVIPIVSAQSAPELTVVDKTAAVERTIYGTEQTGSLVERLSKVEKEIYGLESKDALLSKADRLYTYTKETSNTAPSLITRLNAIEWTLTHTQTTNSAKVRLENLEQMLTGSPTNGPMEARLVKLSKLAYADAQPEFVAVDLTKDSLVKIKLVSVLDTKKNRVGDTVNFQVAEDLFVNGVLVMAKGSSGTGKITKIEPAKNFGRDAKLEVSFDSVQAVDGTTVITFLGDKAKEETKSLAKAAGATVAGLAILGPVGIVGGAFVQGQDVLIPSGTEMFIQTKDMAPLFGIKVK